MQLQLISQIFNNNLKSLLYNQNTLLKSFSCIISTNISMVPQRPPAPPLPSNHLKPLNNICVPTPSPLTGAR